MARHRIPLQHEPRAVQARAHEIQTERQRIVLINDSTNQASHARAARPANLSRSGAVTTATGSEARAVRFVETVGRRDAR